MIRFLLPLAACICLCCGGERLPEYSTGGATMPYLVVWQETGPAPRRVSLAGSFNGDVPGLWQMERRQGRWQAFLKLTNGVYRYRFAAEDAQGQVAFFHDPSCTFVFDDGWEGGSRDPRRRNCLYITTSGFVASNGRKLPLPGGIQLPAGRLLK